MTQNEQLMILVRLIVAGDTTAVSKTIRSSPDMVRTSLVIGATRIDAANYFFREIGHYIYEGDTALHMAAAAFRSEIAQNLIGAGANCAAKNRRGQEPLHYAADGNRNPKEQKATIDFLILAGANPNALDKSGVAPLHRAVRTRAATAVQALLTGGADIHLRNGSGNAAIHLAVQNTGKSGSGTPGAIEQQRKIIQLLLGNGAKPADKDNKGKTVRDIATSDWIRALLE